MSMNSISNLIDHIETSSPHKDQIFHELMLEFVGGMLTGKRASAGRQLTRKVPSWNMIGNHKNSETFYMIDGKSTLFPSVDKRGKSIHPSEHYDEMKSSTFYGSIDHRKKMIGVLPTKNLGSNYDNLFKKTIEYLTKRFPKYTIYGKKSMKAEFSFITEEFNRTNKNDTYIGYAHERGMQELYIIQHGKVVVEKSTSTHTTAFIDDYGDFIYEYRFQGRIDRKNKIVTLLDNDNYSAIPKKAADGAAKILQKKYKSYTIILFTSNASYEWF